MTPKLFAKRLKLAREEYGYSQKQLGLRIGLSDKSISIYEKGAVYPPVSNLMRIAKELKKDLDYFLKD
ncbi:MAG: Transcriptional regulator, XRE family [candidate division WS6 bacterium GW2011_GWC1_36_11]|uniref:Transcriptional regulator, XRE family n=3 Tax=Candidatus Dojkabacteria TaxID=74243 RepID=A0A0G0GKF2_9BACT|nr:MAG: Transcriptional regulator, XRE family [candidate division WS6 bacterium GW2011_GWC1_36_11]KKQ04481.1 MAG: Transcriptional regulator, XRE family [candidate division WS6 bacterium GW2011_WS6_36_26]KKQ11270.1 MAG: Transcriptional regulator, XRE family [candidate division WS6 bacterium GW2011_GWE1_36_69]KKQ11868.1 MAG: Transcriptional regulator, XRE family [candidate division WS6 bacterium GW2011_GWC2_36_7]KKQ17162.1 MAG: Transcriptional regulator, XRE family [candidate division WS6 bacteri